MTGIGLVAIAAGCLALLNAIQPPIDGGYVAMGVALIVFGYQVLLDP